MRIITGTARGTKLKAPKGQNTRPTADRIKESLFNILSSFVYDKRVLDLFSGTGNLALEALSRGAKTGVSVDMANESIAVIKANAKQTHLEDKLLVMKMDVFAAIKKLHQNQQKFAIIFCDPPYHHELCNKVFDSLAMYPILDQDGIIIMEHAIEDILPEEIHQFKLIRRKKYGSTTQISIYELSTSSLQSEE